VNSTFHTAGWVMIDPGNWIPNGVVEILDRLVVAVHRSHTGARTVDHGPGVIMPALVNAHTHLSLSALKGCVDTSTGFIDWVRQLIEVRARFSETERDAAAVHAAQGVKQRGTGCVAEVGPIEPGASAMRRAGLRGVLFSELLGNDGTALTLPNSDPGLSFSYAGHALHTTAPGVLAQLKRATLERRGIFSLHLAESEAETEFLATARGAWATLLASRGIDFSSWDLRGERPVPRAERLGLLGPDTVAVHALDVTADDVATLAHTGTSVCICPRSNAALHERLPDVDAFVAARVTVALGTDSLASTPSLDLFDEMAFIAEHYPALSPETILTMATVNGARALDRHDEGHIEPGNAARLIYVGLEAASARSAASQLVSTPPEQVAWI
jgi:cytosine/adenosine deaminase-related metal-dependent hydrolase